MAEAGPTTQRMREDAQRRPATDPPTRPDGRCLRCLGERPRGAVKHNDPFCSSTCARSWYGTELRGLRGGGEA